MTYWEQVLISVLVGCESAFGVFSFVCKAVLACAAISLVLNTSGQLAAILIFAVPAMLAFAYTADYVYKNFDNLDVDESEEDLY